jgi:2-polyprenyl-6-methoxyphenol hydroxylase-like FAD-dependent oxidoreductase
MRGDLCDILYNAANAFPNVTFLFDSKLQELQQSPTSVSITLSDGTSSNYDMVVAADGFRSGTRKLILEDEDDQTNIKSQNCWIAYFSIPCQPQDGPRSRGYNAVGGRFVMVRPRDEKISCAYLLVSHDAKALREASRAGMPAQKAALAEVFADAGWEVTRVLEGMKDTEDFYLQEIAKIELGAKGWSKERCAYCSFTGTGTTLAILGGYVLAGEILLSHMELAVAFKAYEDKLSGYVVKAQSAPGGPEMFVPQTWLGVKIIRTLLWFASWSGIARWLGGYKMPKFEVPEYDFDGRQL